MPEPGRILVVRGGAIGDFILTLPVFAALRAQFPTARIDAMANPRVASLAQAGQLVDEVRPIESRALAGFFADRGELDPGLAEYLAGFAIVISYLYDPDGIFKTNVGLCTRALFIEGTPRPDETQKVHATEVFLRALERLAIFEADPVPRLMLEPSSTRNPEIALHPGSGSERKNWAEKSWSELLEHLIGMTDRPLLVVGGEAEGERLERLARIAPGGRIEVLQNRPLTELALRLGRCAGFLGHDSGVTHLAAAVGCPVVALWGESVEEIWRPRGSNVKILRGPGGLNTLSVEQVISAMG